MVEDKGLMAKGHLEVGQEVQEVPVEAVADHAISLDGRFADSVPIRYLAQITKMSIP